MILWQYRIVGITASIILHLFAISILIPEKLHQKSSLPPEKSPPPIQMVLIQEPPTQSEIATAEPMLIPLSDIESEIHKPAYDADPIICEGKDKNYFGVGFVFMPGKNVVTRVPAIYPAYKAGIRPGDIILNPNAPILEGYVTFDVQRGKEFLRFRMKAENICYKEY